MLQRQLLHFGKPQQEVGLHNLTQPVRGLSNHVGYDEAVIMIWQAAGVPYGVCGAWTPSNLQNRRGHPAYRRQSALCVRLTHSNQLARYDADHRYRTYAIIWGAVLTGVFTLIPTFKHMRIICILGLVGTSYTAVRYSCCKLFTPRRGPCTSKEAARDIKPCFA